MLIWTIRKHQCRIPFTRIRQNDSMGHQFLSVSSSLCFLGCPHGVRNTMIGRYLLGSPRSLRRVILQQPLKKFYRFSLSRQRRAEPNNRLQQLHQLSRRIRATNRRQAAQAVRAVSNFASRIRSFVLLYRGIEYGAPEFNVTRSGSKYAGESLRSARLDEFHRCYKTCRSHSLWLSGSPANTAACTSLFHASTRPASFFWGVMNIS